MSESTPFDASAPEGDAGHSGQYVTKRDVRILVVGSILLLLILVPVYRVMRANSYKSVCGTNLGQIYKALSMYTLDHDERFPPLFASTSDGQPYIDKSGYPYTWISDVSQQMSARASFVCPAAESEENTLQQSKDSGKLIRGSYGMYAPYGGVARFDIENPDAAALIVETSNHGSKGSFDPIPLNSIYDGYIAGWSDGDMRPTEKSDSVTRLAYRGTAKGLFDPDGDSRHPIGLHFVTVSGKKIYLGPAAATIKQRDGRPSGIWTVPLSSSKR